MCILLSTWSWYLSIWYMPVYESGACRPGLESCKVISNLVSGLMDLLSTSKTCKSEIPWSGDLLGLEGLGLDIIFSLVQFLLEHFDKIIFVLLPSAFLCAQSKHLWTSWDGRRGIRHIVTFCHVPLFYLWMISTMASFHALINLNLEKQLTKLGEARTIAFINDTS